jgi:hypothetical protein
LCRECSMFHGSTSFHFTLPNRFDQIFGLPIVLLQNRLKQFTYPLEFSTFLYVHTASSQFLLFTDVTRGIVGMTNINDPEKQTTIIRAVKPLAVTYHLLQKVSTNHCHSVLFRPSWKLHINSDQNLM